MKTQSFGDFSHLAQSGLYGTDDPDAPYAHLLQRGMHYDLGDGDPKDVALTPEARAIVNAAERARGGGSGSDRRGAMTSVARAILNAAAKARGSRGSVA